MNTTAPPAPTRTTAATACAGACNNRWRAAEKQRLTTGTAHDLTPRAGDPVWCQPCTATIATALASMPELAARLLLEIENGTTTGSEHVSGSREQPLHEHELPARLIEEIAYTLADWEDDVRDSRQLSARRPGRPQGAQITDAARFLHAHFQWLMEQHQAAAAQAFGQDLLHLYRRAQRITKTDEPRPVACAGVPCPKCDMMALEHEQHRDGSQTGYIRCRRCPNLLSRDEYERWTKMYAAPYRKKTPA